MSKPAETPKAPYYAVIFTTVRTAEEDHAYAQTSDEMMRLVAEQPGFLGVETARGADGLGITVSYWTSPEAIAAWRANADHRTAQRLGRETFYRSYRLRVAVVESDTAWSRRGLVSPH